jgi:hypothetical protein
MNIYVRLLLLTKEEKSWREASHPDGEPERYSPIFFYMVPYCQSTPALSLPFIMVKKG